MFNYPSAQFAPFINKDENSNAKEFNQLKSAYADQFTTYVTSTDSNEFAIRPVFKQSGTRVSAYGAVYTKSDSQLYFYSGTATDTAAHDNLIQKLPHANWAFYDMLHVAMCNAFSLSLGLPVVVEPPVSDIDGIYPHINNGGVENTARMIFVIQSGRAQSFKLAPTLSELAKTGDTYHERAIREVMSKYNSKLKAGYVMLGEVAEDLNGDLATRPPMLAGDCTEEPVPKGKFMIQPKLNGIRALYYNGRFLSREKTPLVCGNYYLDHCRYFSELVSQLTGCVVKLDGELYAHGVSLQDINSLVKNTDAPGPVKYHIFTYDDLGHNPAFDRAQILEEAFNTYMANIKEESRVITVIQGLIMESENDIQAHFIDLVNQGFEGIMMYSNVPYNTGRSKKALIKRKKYYVDDFEVVAIVPATGNQRDLALIVVDMFGRKVQCVPKYSHDTRRWLLNNACVEGMTATVKWFGRSNDDVAMNPTAIAICINGEQLVDNE